MRSLPDLQRDLALALLGREPNVGWGIAAYRNNAFGNWAGALASAYPIVCKIVGAEFFRAMAHAYAREHASTSGDLREYGAQLSSFVADFAPTQDLPYLPDVTRMEWIAHLAYYAPDAAPLDASMLARLDPETCSAMRLKLAPGSALLQSDWPLARIWEVHQDTYRGEVAVEFSPGPHYALVHRPLWRVEVSSLSPAEYRFFAGAARGEPLGELLEAAALIDSTFDPSAVLVRWVGSRALAP